MASVRDATPVFWKMAFRWLLTVCSLMQSASAIPWLESPSARNDRDFALACGESHVVAGPDGLVAVREGGADHDLAAVDREERTREISTGE